MLKLYDSGGNPNPLILEDYTITHKYDGDDTLEFDISIKHDLYKFISEESVIDTAGNRFLVKNIDERKGSASVTCVLDLRDWDASFWHEYPVESLTLSDRLNKIKPSGWTVENADIVSSKATISDDQEEDKSIKNVTPRTLLSKCSSLYGVSFNFDCINKRIICVDPNAYEASGEFLTDELNLKSIGITGDSNDLITRLYCYGKDDLTFSDINNGKEYVEDFSYTDRIICGVWTDERYTVKENFLADAKTKITEMAYPVRSYECDTVSLGQYNLYQVVTLIDRVRRTRIDHQIVEYAEHPMDHSQDKITLSSVQDRIETSIKRIAAAITDVSNKTAKTITAVNGMYTASDVDKAIKAEQERADEAYCPKPETGSVQLTASAPSKTISVSYTDFFVALTPGAAGNCWVEIETNSLTISADTPMTVYYSITKKE